MISLTDQQLSIVQHTATLLPVEKRDVFLQRVAAILLQRRKFNDDDVADAVELSLVGLVQQSPHTSAFSPSGARV